uniref:Uncharacterized protein n=1 Tax=Rhizophora mucronata TaxID=61149 RepID=A0A2P2KUJ0_RHIMU
MIQPKNEKGTFFTTFFRFFFFPPPFLQSNQEQSIKQLFNIFNASTLTMSL